MKRIYRKMPSLRGGAGRTWTLLSLGFFFLTLSVASGMQVGFAYAATGESSPKAQAARRGDPVAGKAIYDRHCHYCHGTRGLGDGPVGTAITPHPADFVHDSKRMKKSDEKLFKSISEGVQRKIGGEAMAMPRWAHILSVQDIWNVLSYVRELERKGRASEGLEINDGTGAGNAKKTRNNGKVAK